MIQVCIVVAVALLVGRYGLVGGLLCAGGYWLLGALAGAILFLVGLALLLVLIGGVR